MIRPSILGACFAASVLVFSGAAIAGPYDGQWIMSTTSNRSNCGGGTNELSIADGKISGSVIGKNGTYTAKGTVSDEGKVRMKLDTGTVIFKGKADGAGLKGNWNAGHCMGRFTMMRK
ncbi:MAG: hypothetical protein OEN23_05790 [Paracoccaceae bacterium]|nr:hypothetical protein [Paracoccaceae bacterium]